MAQASVLNWRWDGPRVLAVGFIDKVLHLPKWRIFYSLFLHYHVSMARRNRLFSSFPTRCWPMRSSLPIARISLPSIRSWDLGDYSIPLPETVYRLSEKCQEEFDSVDPVVIWWTRRKALFSVRHRPVKLRAFSASLGPVTLRQRRDFGPWQLAEACPAAQLLPLLEKWAWGKATTVSTYTYICRVYINSEELKSNNSNK